MGVVAGAIGAVTAISSALIQGGQAEKAREAQMSAAERAKASLETGMRGGTKRVYNMPDGRQLSQDEFNKLTRAPGGGFFKKMLQEGQITSDTVEVKGYDQYMDQAEIDLDTAYDLGLQRMEQGMAEMQAGYQRARGDLDVARADIEAGIERFDPYAQAGTRALSGYEKMLTEPSTIFDSPIYSSKEARLTKLLSAQAAQTGRLGASADITARFAPAYQQLMEQEYASALGRYQPLIQYGYGAAGQQAGLNQALAGVAGQQASYAADVGRRMMAGRTFQSGLDVERGQRQAGIQASRGAMEYTHSGNLANIEMGKGAIEANYFNQIGNIYGGLAEQAGEFAGQLIGGMK